MRSERDKASENPYESPRLGTLATSEPSPNAAYKLYSRLEMCLIIAATAVVALAAGLGLLSA